MIYSILAKEKKHLNGKDYYKHLAQRMEAPVQCRQTGSASGSINLTNTRSRNTTKNGDGGVVRVPASEWLENCESQ